MALICCKSVYRPIPCVDVGEVILRKLYVTISLSEVLMVAPKNEDYFITHKMATVIIIDKMVIAQYSIPQRHVKELVIQLIHNSYRVFYFRN